MNVYVLTAETDNEGGFILTGARSLEAAQRAAQEERDESASALNRQMDPLVWRDLGRTGGDGYRTWEADDGPCQSLRITELDGLA